jgi:hypothetical protein
VTKPRLVRITLCVALVLSLSLAGIATANGKRADFDIVSGKTVLSPDVDTFEALSDYGITVTPVEGAKSNNHGLVFPIVQGEVTDQVIGTIEHSGGVQFTNANTGATVVLDDFLLKLGSSKAKLFATSGTDAFRFLTIDMSGASFGGHPGGALKISGIDGTLAKPAAKVLTELAGTEINKGTPIGALKVKAQTHAQ